MVVPYYWSIHDGYPVFLDVTVFKQRVGGIIRRSQRGGCEPPCDRSGLGDAWLATKKVDFSKGKRRNRMQNLILLGRYVYSPIFFFFLGGGGGGEGRGFYEKRRKEIVSIVARQLAT